MKVISKALTLVLFIAMSLWATLALSGCGSGGFFDLTGEHAGTTSIPGQSLSLLSYTGGPRFSYPLHRRGRIRMVPFVQALAGAVHGFDGQFPDHSGALSNSATNLAVLVGGGLDLQLNHRLAVRAGQVDYGLNQLPNNANNRENLPRVSVGMVLRLR